MKVGICTGAWRRYELFDFFCRYYREIFEVLPGFQLYAAVSEGRNSEIAKRYGHKVVEIQNDPLHAKFNAVNQLAGADGCDYVINIGSDDIMSPILLRHYLTLFDRSYDYIAPLDWYFFDTQSKRGLYWKGYTQTHNVGKPCGAGRALSKLLMMKLDWSPWSAGFDKVLDTGMQVRVSNVTPRCDYFFRLRDHGLFAVDIKTQQNMTPFADWENTYKFGGRELLTAYLPDYAEQILKL